MPTTPYPYPAPSSVADQSPASILSLVLNDSAADLRITGARTLANLAARNRVRSVSQTNMDWPVRFSGATTGVAPVETDTSKTETDKVAPATLRVGRQKVFANRPISRIAIEEAASRAPGDLRNLFAEEVNSAVLEIARKLNRLIYQGDGTLANAEVFGLASVLNNTVAYAGIDPATYPEWKAIKIANAGTARAFTRRLMLDHGVIYGNLERNYDMVVMSPLTAAKYQEIFDTLAGANSIAHREEGNALVRADLGHGGRAFNGMPIIEDPVCPDGQMLTLDSSQISMPCFTVGNDPQRPISNIAVNTAIGVPIHIAELPSSNSLYRYFEFYVMPQLQVRDRSAVGGIFDLLTA
jgi:hypothetical protein